MLSPCSGALDAPRRAKRRTQRAGIGVEYPHPACDHADPGSDVGQARRAMSPPVLVLLVAMTGLTATDSISAVACTIGNIGPGFGVVGATQTFATLHPFAKLVLCVSMLLGRLELFTLMIMLRPEFWRGTRKW